MTSTTKTLLILALVLVVGIAVVLAVTKEDPSSASRNNVDTVEYKQPAPSKVSDEEAESFAKGPGANLTQAQLTSFHTKVGEAAVQTSLLDITNCKATPNVLLIKQGASLDIQNKDTISHKISYGQLTQNVAAESITNAKLTFPNPGNYGFRCDDSQNLVGMFLVIP